MTKFPGMVLRRQNKPLNFLEKASKVYRPESQQRRCCTKWDSDNLKTSVHCLTWLPSFTNFVSYISPRKSEPFRLYVLSFERNFHGLHCCQGQKSPTQSFYDFLIRKCWCKVPQPIGKTKASWHEMGRKNEQVLSCPSELSVGCGSLEQRPSQRAKCHSQCPYSSETIRALRQ